MGLLRLNKDDNHKKKKKKKRERLPKGDRKSTHAQIPILARLIPLCNVSDKENKDLSSRIYRLCK